VHSWEQINQEREQVKGENEGNGPFQNRGSVISFAEVADCEGDGEDYFDEDERELGPEGGTEDAVLAEV